MDNIFGMQFIAIVWIVHIKLNTFPKCGTIQKNAENNEGRNAFIE